VLDDVTLTSDGALDVDVPAVHVQGAVTVDEQAMSSATHDRGSLGFDLDDGSTLSTRSFGTSGPASYSLTLLAGSYDVLWEGNPESCGPGSTSPVPCNSGPVIENVQLSADGGLDVNVPAVQVQGAVSVNGQSMPPASAARGALAFDLNGGASVSTTEFEPTGPATYALTLLSGSYVVRWEGNAALCGPGSTAPVPCNGGRVLENVTLEVDGALDVDVPSVVVSGVLTLDGSPFPSTGESRGALELRLVTGDVHDSSPFAATGPATFQSTLLAGNYVVTHRTGEGLCAPGSSFAFPCADQILVGCP
jgi:hypothetical protein